MNRKSFFKKLAISVAAIVIGKITLPQNTDEIAGLKKGGRYPFGYTIKRRCDGETSMAIHDTVSNSSEKIVIKRSFGKVEYAKDIVNKKLHDLLDELGLNKKA